MTLSRFEANENPKKLSTSYISNQNDFLYQEKQEVRGEKRKPQLTKKTKKKKNVLNMAKHKFLYNSGGR